MYVKLPMYFFLGRLDLMVLMRANPLLGPWEWVGPCNGCCRIKIIIVRYIPRHNNRYINSNLPNFSEASEHFAENLKYPRSQAFLDLGCEEEAYIIMGHTADQTHKVVPN
jgi:hypothetical protein